MWMPAQTTVPPGATARRATGTSSPAGAKMIAASSGSGSPPLPGSETSEPPSVSPAQAAPSSSAKRCVSASPGRVSANTRRPWWAATWQTMWAEAPKP